MRAMSPIRRQRKLLRATLAGLAAATSFLVACQADTGETLGGTFCTYKQTLACTTDAGCRGTSTCLPDLSDYGPCVCGDGGAADASGGTP